MYKSTSKLPYWKRESSPSYRRNALRRGYGLFIIFVVLPLLLYWYYISEVPQESRRTTINPKIEDVEPPKPEILATQSLPQKKENEVEVDVASPLLEERSEIDNDNSPSETAPPKEVSPEYAEDDTPGKQAVLDSRKKPISVPSEIIGEEPPALVKQASEKLIEQHLSPAVKYDEIQQKEKNVLKSASKHSGPQKFPTYSEYAALNEMAEALPDIVHLPFEDTTSEVILQGWEDQWFADAEFDVVRWGTLNETKIDFVYTCKNLLKIT